jgi:hypothetical protein
MKPKLRKLDLPARAVREHRNDVIAVRRRALLYLPASAPPLGLYQMQALLIEDRNLGVLELSEHQSLGQAEWESVYGYVVRRSTFYG